MERKLLILGMLRMQEMHGYHLNDFIDTHLGASIQLTKPTAYNLLNKMSEEGWISYQDTREGNRPPRRVYTITPQGEAAFQKMLRECLADYKPTEFQSDIALAFLEMLPIAEAISLLQKRRQVIEAFLEPFRNSGDAHRQGSFQLLIEHRRTHLSAELAWVAEVITRLARKETT